MRRGKRRGNGGARTWNQKSFKSSHTSSPARRVSWLHLLVTRNPLSQRGSGGGAVSCVSSSEGNPMECVAMLVVVGFVGFAGGVLRG